MLKAKTTLMIRETTSADLPQIRALYPQAFPEEDLRPVVANLLEGTPEVLSLAGFDENKLVAHILFTLCSLEDGGPTTALLALLAPLGVMPTHQRQGLGSALVREGFERLKQMRVAQVFVLGDPAYYHRFGFAPDWTVLAPYPLPEGWADAWQSKPLAAHATQATGKLLLPEPWMDPALWAP